MALSGCWFSEPQKTEEKNKEYVLRLNAKLATDEIRLRMFYFCGRSYAEEYSVLARSKSDALKYLKEYCSNKDSINFNEEYTNHMDGKYPYKISYSNFEEYLEKEGYHTKNYNEFVSGFGLILELDEGVVIQTEVS